ncbi:type VI secretion system protein TssA [Acerihabitans arboris]|uniref:Type VI secretion system protein TssA n=1 Tax=Acerihabitans arboris TaxID=2691583 RepID=A0A845SHN3_9GAMM|nr:type VI secretion system protein TssA [Acerihabitans arboris]NDL64390.1 type VI secretion system protein TssA [Acerihabitans arboris]
MNINDLLTPVTADAPCGENLEYDLSFMQMIQLARGKAEQQFGDTLIPAQEPDWRQVEKHALDLLACSKDLRVMLLLAQAWTALRGLAGYADGVMLIGEALGRYWQPLLPPLALEGEADPLMRINLLRELGDSFDLAKLLRRSPFARDAGQSLTFADAVAALDGLGTVATGYPGGPARMAAAIQRGLAAHARHIPLIGSALERLFCLLREHLGETALPDMPGQLAALRTLSRALATMPPPDLPEPSPVPVRAVSTDPAAAQPSSWREGGILTRDDAYRALEQVKIYFTQYESSHPAPLMIARIQGLMSQDFMAIVGNLAPEAVSQLERFFGCKDHKEQER